MKNHEKKNDIMKNEATGGFFPFFIIIFILNLSRKLLATFHRFKKKR